MIPPKPKGSSITESSTADSYTLRWPMPSAGSREFFSALPLLCLLASLVYQSTWMFQAQGFAQLGWTPVLIFLPMLVILIPMLTRLRPSRPESITLGVDSFRHDLG